MEHIAAPRLMTGMEERAAAQTGDFELIVSLYRPKVFRFALASLRDRDSADIVTQDCFWKAYRTWHAFRHECSVDTWLMRIAVNLVRDHVRNRRLRFWKRTQQTARPVEALSDWFAAGDRSPEAQVLLKQQVEGVWEAAASLPERQRTVFLLRFVEDMDLLEIAAAAGMKEGTVKAHLFRALKTVREKLGARV
jgi:RNA polymerase sigma-70 factor (ECF subfamily)